MEKRARIFTEVAHTQLHDQLHKSTSKPNVFEMILANENIPPSDKVYNRISHEGVVTIAAGGETTARALTVATYFVLSHKDSVLAKLKAELGSAMPTTDSKPSIKDLERLPWLV